LYCSTVKLESRQTTDIVTVKNKFQIVIPRHVREQVHIEIGDFLEAGVEEGKITFTSKSLVERHLAEGLEDARHGRTRGPYIADEAIAALDARAKRDAPNARHEAALYRKGGKGLCGHAGRYPQGVRQTTALLAGQSQASPPAQPVAR